jgi:hypothetical protein
MSLARRDLTSYHVNRHHHTTRAIDPAMIDRYLLTSSIRRDAPSAFVLQGAVRPKARISGGTTAGGRAP